MSLSQFELDKLDIKRELDALLAKPHLDASNRKRADLLLTKMANMRSQEELLTRFDRTIGKEFSFDPRTEDEKRARAQRTEQAFESYLRSGSLTEYRTYAPESTATAGALIPQEWAAAYQSKLTSFSGIREAGANIVSTPFGGPFKYPFSNDSGNTGERLDENTQVDLTNPTLSLNSLPTFRYVSKGIQYSNEIAADSTYDISAYLQKLFARRIGSITNKEFTLGASGGPTGVLPSITNIQTGSSATTASIFDLASLQAIDQAYLADAVYMISPSVERDLKSKVDSGLRVFPEMTDKMLLGYPYILNANMPVFGANNLCAVFGSFKSGVTIRQAAPTLLISRERYAELYMSYASLTHRQNCVVTDTSALSVLQNAAS